MELEQKTVGGTELPVHCMWNTLCEWINFVSVWEGKRNREYHH